MSLPAGVTSYEQVVFGNDEVVGLHAIVAVHSTALGPALGGTRFVDYADPDAALADDVTSTLMGDDVDLRKQFITTNARDVRNLDF